MILLSEDIRAWGHIVTAHFTHPPRAAITQIALSSRSDFTQLSPTTSLLRAGSFLTGYVAGGENVDLSGAPNFAPAQFRAEELTEFRAQLIADNCGARAVITQFAWKGEGSVFLEPTTAHIVAFGDSSSGTVAFKHIVKSFGEGRPVSKAEAIERAKADATRFFVDVASFEMTVT